MFPSWNQGESVASFDLGAVSFNFAHGSSRALPARQSVGRQHFRGGVHCHQTCSQCSNGAGARDALRKGHQIPELVVESACWRFRCWSTSSTAWRSFHLDLSGRQRETEQHWTVFVLLGVPFQIPNLPRPRVQKYVCKATWNEVVLNGPWACGSKPVLRSTWLGLPASHRWPLWASLEVSK